MQFQSYNKILICKDNIKDYYVMGIVLGYCFQIRYPSYRGTFLSCIEKLSFIMDGKEINESDIRFSLNGKQFLLSELKDQYKEYWSVLETATIVVLTDSRISRGSHTLTVDMHHRIPYAGYDGHYLTLPSVVTQILTTGDETQ